MADSRQSRHRGAACPDFEPRPRHRRGAGPRPQQRRACAARVELRRARESSQGDGKGDPGPPGRVARSRSRERRQHPIGREVRRRRRDLHAADLCRDRRFARHRQISRRRRRRAAWALAALSRSAHQRAAQWGRGADQRVQFSGVGTGGESRLGASRGNARALQARDQLGDGRAPRDGDPHREEGVSRRRPLASRGRAARAAGPARRPGRACLHGLRRHRHAHSRASQHHPCA